VTEIVALALAVPPAPVQVMV
jgi:hypothetical protein